MLQADLGVVTAVEKQGAVYVYTVKAAGKQIEQVAAMTLAAGSINITAPHSTGTQVIVLWIDERPVIIGALHYNDNAVNDGLIVSDGSIQIKTTKDVVIEAGGKVELAGTGGKGVVTGDCVCPYTGNNHADLSTKVLAIK